MSDGRHTPRALEALFSHAGQGVVFTHVDPDDPEVLRIEDANPAFLRQLGHTLAQLRGTDLTTLVCPSSDARKLQRLVRRAVQTHCPIGGRLCLVKPGSPGVHTEITLVPLGHDELGRVLVLVRDVTERDELAARLSHAERLAAVGSLAAGLGHEINSPLGAVLAHLQLLEEALPRMTGALEQSAPHLLASAGQLDEHVVAARHAAEQVSATVRSLQLLVAGHGGGDGDAELSLPEIVDAAIRLARPELRPRARVVRSYQPTPMVIGDAMRLQQVLLQLLLHLARVLPEGGSEGRQVRVALTTGSDGGALITLACSAPDVSPESLCQGLGPSISQTIVAAQGGRLAVELDDQGACFVMELPARLAAPVPVPAPRARVLIVDDDAQLVASLVHALGDEHEVVAAGNGAAALERLRRESRWDLVLCDVQMDGLSGIDVLETLRDEAPALAERLVFMTGGAATEGARAYLARCPSECLGKPFELEQLRALVRRRLRGRRGRGEERSS